MVRIHSAKLPLAYWIVERPPLLVETQAAEELFGYLVLLDGQKIPEGFNEPDFLPIASTISVEEIFGANHADPRLLKEKAKSIEENLTPAADHIVICERECYMVNALKDHGCQATILAPAWTGTPGTSQFLGFILLSY